MMSMSKRLTCLVVLSMALHGCSSTSVKKAVKKVRTVANVAAETADAKAFAKAIMASETEVAPFADGPAANARENVTFTATRRGGEVEFTFTGPANGAAEFKETGEAVHTIRGWFGKMLGRSDEGGSAREMVTVYTDIEASTPALFSDVTAYSGLGAGRQLTLQPAAHGSLAASDSFPEAADKGQVNTRTYEENEARSFTGALQGGEGTFRCTGSTCTVTADDEGALSWRAERAPHRARHPPPPCPSRNRRSTCPPDGGSGPFRSSRISERRHCPRPLVVDNVWTNPNALRPGCSTICRSGLEFSGRSCTTETAFGYFRLLGRPPSATDASLPVTKW